MNYASYFLFQWLFYEFNRGLRRNMAVVGDKVSAARDGPVDAVSSF